MDYEEVQYSWDQNCEHKARIANIQRILLEKVNSLKRVGRMRILNM